MRSLRRAGRCAPPNGSSAGQCGGNLCGRRTGDLGCTDVLEIGPVRGLAQTTRRISPDADVHYMGGQPCWNRPAASSAECPCPRALAGWGLRSPAGARGFAA
ncbi:hypothetical protein [Actinomadura geliboluensis]|uniref:hypothetical protein n=1 Tax=Actinomadura geliboluensis TaxID=882440 RepID=UPI00110B4925|nr:hypothetical protein [Actinomadura geliboluensis]